MKSRSNVCVYVYVCCMYGCIYLSIDGIRTLTIVVSAQIVFLFATARLVFQVRPACGQSSPDLWSNCRDYLQSVALGNLAQPGHA